MKPLGAFKTLAEASAYFRGADKGVADRTVYAVPGRRPDGVLTLDAFDTLEEAQSFVPASQDKDKPSC